MQDKWTKSAREKKRNTEMRKKTHNNWDTIEFWRWCVLEVAVGSVPAWWLPLLVSHAWTARLRQYAGWWCEASECVTERWGWLSVMNKMEDYVRLGGQFQLFVDGWIWRSANDVGVKFLCNICCFWSFYDVCWMNMRG